PARHAARNGEAHLGLVAILGRLRGLFPCFDGAAGAERGAPSSSRFRRDCGVLQQLPGAERAVAGRPPPLGSRRGGRGWGAHVFGAAGAAKGKAGGTVGYPAHAAPGAVIHCPGPRNARPFLPNTSTTFCLVINLLAALRRRGMKLKREGVQLRKLNNKHSALLIRGRIIYVRCVVRFPLFFFLA
ncbi:unnamed protein product, partial [Ectocarpus fasciculatus]